MPHFMIVLIPYINLLNLSWIINCLFLRNMEPLKATADGNSVCLSQPVEPDSLIWGFIFHLQNYFMV